MQFFTIAFFALVTVVFVAVKLGNTLIKESKTKNTFANAVILAASYVFVIYADYRFALALAVLTAATWFLQKRRN